MLDLIHEIGQTLRNNRTRTFLTGLSVAWGIFMLIILLGAARGVTNSFEESTAETNFNVITIFRGRTTKPYQGYREGRTVQLRQSDGDVLRADLPQMVSAVAPKASVDTAAIVGTRSSVSGGFQAVAPEYQKNDNVTILHGRFVNERDMAEGRRVMIIHQANARILFGGDPADAVGKTVRSMGLAWTVAGVYDHRWDKQAYVPYTAYKRITGNDDKAYMLDVNVDGLTTQEQAEAAEADIRASLGKIHHFAPDDRGALWMWNHLSQHFAATKATSMLSVAVWLIGLLTLLTGIVGVSNIMFVSVRERTHEIGIRRAIGAKPRAILTQILTESVALTAVFGYAGLFLGMAVLQIINALIGKVDGFSNPTVNICIAVEVTAALILAGALAGLFPALKALKVKPVEALRDE